MALSRVPFSLLLALVLTGCPAPLPTSESGPSAPPSTSPAAPARLALSGTATFQGAPVANAELVVRDARTGAALADGIRTDAQGRYAVTLTELAAVPAIRVVVSTGPGSALAATAPVAPATGAGAGYRLAQADQATQIVDIDATTTALTVLANGPLSLLPTDDPGKAAALAQQLLSKLEALASTISSQLAGQPPAANAVAESILPGLGVLKTGNQGSAVAALVATDASRRTLAEAIVETLRQAAGAITTLAAPIRLVGLDATVSTLGNQLVVTTASGKTLQPGTLAAGDATAFAAAVTTVIGRPSSGGSGSGSGNTLPATAIWSQETENSLASQPFSLLATDSAPGLATVVSSTFSGIRSGRQVVVQLTKAPQRYDSARLGGSWQETVFSARLLAQTGYASWTYGAWVPVTFGGSTPVTLSAGSATVELDFSNAAQAVDLTDLNDSSAELESVGLVTNPALPEASFDANQAFALYNGDLSLVPASPWTSNTVTPETRHFLDYMSITGSTLRLKAGDLLRFQLSRAGLGADRRPVFVFGHVPQELVASGQPVPFTHVYAFTPPAPAASPSALADFTGFSWLGNPALGNSGVDAAQFHGPHEFGAGTTDEDLFDLDRSETFGRRFGRQGAAFQVQGTSLLVNTSGGVEILQVR